MPVSQGEVVLSPATGGCSPAPSASGSWKRGRPCTLGHFRVGCLAKVGAGLNRRLPLLRFPLGPLRNQYPRRWRGVKTCNLGVWRDDLFAVNGFDERYQGWGYEDSDLVLRLIRNGVRCKDGRFALGYCTYGTASTIEPGRRRTWSDSTNRLAVTISAPNHGLDQYLDARP